VWQVRQERTGGLSEPMVAQAHRGALPRPSARGPQGEQRLTARPGVARPVQTMVGPGPVARPSFYCPSGGGGLSPFDRARALAPGRPQLAGPQAAAQRASELPEEEAQTLGSDRTGVALGRARLHTCVPQAAEGLTVLEGARSRDALARRIAARAPGRVRRPVAGRGIDGAYGPTRPDSARERHAGPRHSRARRAAWHGQGRDATGLRRSLSDDARIVPLLRGPQGHNEAHRGAALQQVKEAGVIPPEQVRLWVVCDGASWIWQPVQALFPRARPGLASSPCQESLHKVAKGQYASSARALAWGAAPLTRLYLGKVGGVLGGLRRMPPASAEARKAIDTGWGYLQHPRERPPYRKVRRGGYPIGRGGMASSNKCMGHVWLKRSGAWWYECNGNERWALRCAK
jgi:hypothetical protein